MIQDASTELSVHAIRWAVHGLFLQPGDKIKLLRVVQPFRTTANTSSFSCGMLGKKELFFQKWEKRKSHKYNYIKIRLLCFFFVPWFCFSFNIVILFTNLIF